MKKLKLNELVYFVGENIPMLVKAINDKFAVCTRKLNRREDSDLLHFEVERGAYMSFTDAYNELKNEVVYTCLDFKNNLKAPHNLVLNSYDFKDQESINKLLEDLTNRDVELSRRHRAELNINWMKVNKE